MELHNLEHSELQQILTQLNQALHNHQQWYNDLVRTLICKLPYNKHDIIQDAHKLCRFGQWYYSDALTKINDHPGLIAIGKAHQQMHQLTKYTLLGLDTNDAIAPNEYDMFLNSLERFRLEIDSLKNELENLLNYRDPLTMAINRSSLLPILREQQALIRRQSQSCCITMMDLDLFKKVNDQYGHIVGDTVLASISRYVTNHLRPYDKIFRYGGDEFLICTPQIDLSQAAEMMDRLRERIARFPINADLDAPIYITVSFGIAMLDEHFSVEQSINHADKALYVAKSSGRNCTKTWSDKVI